MLHYVGEHRKSFTFLVLPPGPLLPPKKQSWGGGKGVTTPMKISKYRAGSKFLDIKIRRRGKKEKMPFLMSDASRFLNQFPSITTFKIQYFYSTQF